MIETAIAFSLFDKVLAGLGLIHEDRQQRTEKTDQARSSRSMSHWRRQRCTSTIVNEASVEIENVNSHSPACGIPHRFRCVS
jgi:hypothetical protein